MNIWETRLNFRPRSGFEALDLGARLFQERPLLYMALWATFSLPVYIPLALLLWQQPLWTGFVIWWLKPWFEAPILQVMSQQVFEAPPGYRECVRQVYRLMWRPRSRSASTPLSRSSFSAPLPQLFQSLSATSTNSSARS